MTMRVTITTTLMGESGSLLTAGSTYTVSKAFGASIVGGGRATDTDGVLRNLLQKSDLIRVIAPYTLAAGDGCYVGAMFGVATGPVTSGVAFDMMTTGIFVLSAASAAVATAGDKAYWDNAARTITTTTSDVLVGVFSSDKSSGQLVSTVAVGVYVAGVASASSLAPVSLSANTTLTRAAHYNRLIVVDVSGGNVTLTATGTDALLGDFISVDVIGGGSNTVTLAGVTAQSGYQLTAVSGGNVEARCDVAASFIASTRTISAGGAGATATLALVDGNFTSNNLNLTATHTNRVLDCSAVTIPVTLTIQTDASGGYDTTAAEIKVLGSLTAPVAIVEGTGATVVGKVQVIQQGEWGGARRTVANTWALTEQAKNPSSQYAVCVPNYTGVASVTSMGMLGPNPMDSTVAVTSAAPADGVAEYGVLRRVRYNAAGAGAYRTAGIQHVGGYRVDAKNSSFPLVVRGAIADDITTAGFVLGITRNAALTTAMNAVGYEYSNSDNNDTIALAADTGDTNMQIMHRNGSTNTTATKIDLGSNFPKAKYVGYELTVYKNDTGSAFIAVARNMNTQACVVKVLTTNVPRNVSVNDYTTVLARPNGNNAVLASFDFIGHTIGVAP